MTLFQIKPANVPTKPAKSEINLANINLNEKLACQEIILFTTMACVFLKKY